MAETTPQTGANPTRTHPADASFVRAVAAGTARAALPGLPWLQRGEQTRHRQRAGLELNQRFRRQRPDPFRV